MRVGAADPERGDPGPPRPARRRGQGTGSVSSRTAPGRPVHVRRRLVRVQRRRQHPVLQRQHHLDHPGRPPPPPGCGRCSTSPTPATAAGPPAGPARRSPAAPAPRSGRPARSRSRAPPPRPPRPADSPALASAARITRCCDGPFGAVSPLTAPSWFTALPAHHRQHRVPVAPRVGQPLQHQHPGALGPARCRRRPRRERLAPAVGGQPALPGELDERRRGGHHRHAAGQRQRRTPRPAAPGRPGAAPPATTSTPCPPSPPGPPGPARTPPGRRSRSPRSRSAGSPPAAASPAQAGAVPG